MTTSLLAVANIQTQYSSSNLRAHLPWHCQRRSLQYPCSKAYLHLFKQNHGITNAENGQAITPKDKWESNKNQRGKSILTLAEAIRDMAVASWQNLTSPLQESEVGLTGRSSILHEETTESVGKWLCACWPFTSRGAGMVTGSEAKHADLPRILVNRPEKQSTISDS
ncbi:uncharacterized protein EURHEDRAFT_535132 [Aspergillus ruber CBS 135680]|uniref:Uncharacterized protein n=1 Tax=Aspergillus ruber (strain CBS 135680) TaxID=1388766 RepID=A0A017SSS2_ASPRC|nr:uncharacterized protein EURHEDRAFT_535132 [Aspergillus ruber CBS 135680]EYE99624.1 hypothetical protein EURHEDRAFT_535132 [Aspergillus ruber CBS 135680]